MPATTKTCGGSYREVGPYKQTLFLGCSITNFTMNLGWGSDQSSVTVSLVEDNAYHPLNAIYAPLKQQVRTFNAADVGINNIDNIRSSALEMPNSYNNDNTFTITTDTGNIKTSYSKNLNESSPSRDRYGNLHKDISQQLETQFSEQEGLPTDRDIGKLIWSTKPGTTRPIQWTDPDPGFLALKKTRIEDGKEVEVRTGYDIIGTPVYFKFSDGVEYGGYVHSWKTTGGQGGTPLYEVEIRSYASLLNGVQLIINNYTGSISTIITDTVAVPSLSSVGGFNGSIKRGNLPNVINVFGYLEDESLGGSFGNAAKTSEGVSALQIYYAIQQLLCANSPNKNRYSPYGCIVGKHVVANDGSFVNVSSTVVGGGDSPLAPRVTLADCGLCPNILANDGIYRSLFKLDISELPIPPNDLYIPETNISLGDFIQRICDGAGFDYFVDFEKSNSSNYSGIIKLKVVSKRIQPSKDIIKNLINSLLNANPPLKITNYSYGQSFTDKDTRTMYIGGKQKRLYQAASMHLSLRQNTAVYDPYANNGAGSFMPVSTRYGNYSRVPDAGSTRKNQVTIDTAGASVGQVNDLTIFNSRETMGSDSLSFLRGNYFPVDNLGPGPNAINTPSATRISYALYKDVICPYFGTHGKPYEEEQDTVSSKEPRKVFWDQNLGQLQVIFRNNDITTILTSAYESTGDFVVLENELRAALGGFEVWFSYCFDSLFNTDIADLMYTVFKSKYPYYASKDNFLAGLSIINWNIAAKSAPKTQTVDPRPYAIKLEHSSTYTKNLYADLQNVYDFFNKVASEHYGKTFMVRVPRMRYYREGDLKLKNGNYAYAGGGRIFSDWEISTEGAWEEEGNVIDDTISVGSTICDLFTNDDGLIQPILGFNACGELATKDLWMQSNINPVDWLDANGHAFTKARWGIPDSNGFYFPLQHSLKPSDYVYIPYTSPRQITNVVGSTNYGSLKTSHGIGIPNDWVYKMYVKASVNKQVVFINIGGDRYDPRAIISLDEPILLGGGKNDTDESLLFTQLHDAICVIKRGMSRPQGYGNGSEIRRGPTSANDASAYIFNWMLNAGVIEDGGGISINTSAQNAPINKKATCPFFAAIPITYNRSTYGPWINHPGLIDNIIFNGSDVANSTNLVNNLVGGCKIDELPDYVPWTYGGIDNLDASIMSKIKDDVTYQQIAEEGSISVAGFVLTANDGTEYGLGDILSLSAGSLSGPVITSLNVNIGENGITTNYTMRTYTRKLGFFNKENSERIKALGQESFKRKKQFTTAMNASQSSIKENMFSSNGSNGDTPKPLRWSPLEVLAGAAYSQINPNSSILNSFNDLKFGPDWFQLPIGGSVTYDPLNMIKYLANVGVQDIQELPRELDGDYDRKSIMSLDGLLSPISFFPTLYGTTYNISKYTRERCPVCQGRGTFTYTYLNITPTNLPSSLSAMKNSVTSVTKDCTFCELLEDKKKRAFISASPKETTPPYVIASGDDLQLVNSLRQSGLSGNPVINGTTLNPILMSTGEFSCFQNRQTRDFTAHSIDVVGYGKIIPQEGNSLKPAYSANPNKNFLDYDLNYSEYCSTNNLDPGVIPDNNVRFFGLRGPLMVHAWGYDLEGYPVPNASGEPLIQNGNTVLGVTEGSATTGLIYRNQTQKVDGTWTKPYKENTFYKGWGQLPGTWPVGPIDLRWDEKARLWTVGANYKPVWIKIETDLIADTPIRGVMVEDSSNDVLPSGLRKLVYVKDSLGISPAPRGAQIYCKYDSDNGFYEPIYNRPYVTSGIIQNATAAEIYKLNDSKNTKYSSAYKNPLSFNVANGDIGLFIFMGTDWILQSVRS